MNYSYWIKQNEPPKTDLEWNFPEQKSGIVAVVGGNSSAFSATAKIAEYLISSYSLKNVEIYLPNSLRSKVPLVPGINFVPSTESGSIAKSGELNSALLTADFGLFSGELSKNSATTIAVVEAIKGATCPILLARDAVDLVTPEISAIIEGRKLFLLASTAQLQKVFRSLLYPKMILLAQPIMPMVETLHKFTLSYDECTIITYHQGQIIVANAGKVVTIPLEKTKYSALTFFTGTLPATLLAYNLWNPSLPLDASVSAIFK